MGGRTIAEAVLNISTISYCLNIKELGILQCLYRCMLLPRFMMRYVKKIKNPVYYTLVIVIIIVGISSLHFECPNVGLS